MKFGIIAGYTLESFKDEQDSVIVETRFGNVEFLVERVGNHEVFFLNRHGSPPVLPPHKISYRANIEAMAASHVDCVIAIGAVGSLHKNIQPGDFVVPDDFFDATHSRSVSFFDTRRVHIDMTNPFCPDLRHDITAIGENKKDLTMQESGVYVTTEGSRLETASEIRFYSSIGDVVGMTLVPEVVLAREKGLCYASLCVVCNMGTGMQERLDTQEIKGIINDKKPVLNDLLLDLIQSSKGYSGCSCKHVIEDSLL
jgi:5'-methylthioadenosine phosphorylase